MRKVRNALRGWLQAYGPEAVRRQLWNGEFSRGRWNCLDETPGDCVYPYVAQYANHGSILDLGCGSGSTGNELDAGAYQHYTGVDISDAAIEKACRRTELNRRATKNRYVSSDIFGYVPGGTFDVILFRDSIYYIPHRKITGMLQRYAIYLRASGVFIVRMSNGADEYRAIVDAIHENFDVLEQHVSNLPPALILIFRPRVRVSAARPLMAHDPEVARGRGSDVR